MIELRAMFKTWCEDFELDNSDIKKCEAQLDEMQENYQKYFKEEKVINDFLCELVEERGNKELVIDDIKRWIDQRESKFLTNNNLLS